MKIAWKSLAKIAVLLVGGIILAFIFFSEKNTRPTFASKWISSQQCAACHAQIFEEWQGSMHAQAWTDPLARETSNNFSNTDCIACHAPRPVFEVGVGNRLLPRFRQRVEGVDCLSCHLTPHGVAGTQTNPNVACKPLAMPDLSKPIFCAGCHNQHQTVDEWRATRYAKEGIDCGACHMLKQTLPDGTAYAAHHFAVRNDKQMLASAVTVNASISQQTLTVTVENSGAGHDFPTDSRFKAVDLKYRLIDAQGKAGDWIRIARFRYPFRDDQIDLQRTTIPAGEKREFQVELAETQGKLELRMFYKIQPFLKDEEAVSFYEQIMELGG